jgi:HD-GYP domain-containing protein (c-di-GMP phosphodiesterase class II)
MDRARDENTEVGIVETTTHVPVPSRDPGNEHVVIGRLIRRLCVSESPDRFHLLAANVLRSSLGVEAVAWVPRDAGEPVVVAGSVVGMEPLSYRSLSQSVAHDGASPSEDTLAVRRPRGVPSTARGFIAVAAGTAGWLVAVNTPEDRPFSSAEVERVHYVASLIETQLANARIYTELKGLLFGIIRALTAAIDAKDPYTSGHSERVARIAVRIAEELAMPSPRRSDLYLTGLLHDVGKIGIRDGVLNKPGALSDDEFRAIQSHVDIGVNILKDLTKLTHILPGVRHHHESYDGSGYPDHLSGEGIPFEARILAVADSFDAMSSTRPYRKRLSLMQIDEIFREGRGRQWDPTVVDALFACRGDVESIRQKGLGESLIGAVDVALGRG